MKSNKPLLKAKVVSYAGPNHAVISGGKHIKIAVNVPHPVIGEELEYAETAVVEVLDIKPAPKPEVVHGKHDKDK